MFKFFLFRGINTKVYFLGIWLILFTLQTIMINQLSLGQGLSPEQIRIMNSGALYFNVSEGCAPGSGGIGVVNGNLPPEAQEMINAQLPKIEALKPLYEEASQRTGIPWQVIAAKHYKEGGNDITKSAWAGEQLGTVNPDHGDIKPVDPVENYVSAVDQALKPMAKSVYDVDLTAESSFEDYQKAFLSYNRGVLYKRAINHIGRELTADESPYVMNFFDSSRINMKFPDGGPGPPPWGEPASTRNKTNRTLGTMTMAIGLGFEPGGGISNGECDNGGIGQGPDGFVFPVKATKTIIDTAPGSGVIWCKNNCHGSMWGGAAPYYAHDIGAAEGTEVVAAKGGTVRSLKVGTEQSSIWIEGEDGYWYFYQHLHPNVTMVQQDQTVVAGEVIAQIGPNAINAASGGNTPPHLHFAVGSEQITSMKRGCSRSGCPNADKMVDVLESLLAAYEALPN